MKQTHLVLVLGAACLNVQTTSAQATNAQTTSIQATSIQASAAPPAAPSISTCQPRVKLSQVQAQAVQFGWQPLTPQQQAALPAAHAAPLPPLQGTVYWPRYWPRQAKTTLPAVILLHGSGGTQCDLSSAAWLLAAQGYITLTLTQPDNHTSSSETSGVQALASALKFLDSPSNPARQLIRSDDIALIGHSEGAGVVSMAQGLPGFEAVKAVIALDNLRRWLQGDPGAALRSCTRTPAWPVTPRVPALGLAKDGPCSAAQDTSATIKLSGWNWWHAHGVPAAEIVPAHYQHLTFTDRRATPAQLRWQAKVMGAWLERWLKGNTAALRCWPLQGASHQLSRHYTSALFLPPQPAVLGVRRKLKTQGQCSTLPVVSPPVVSPVS